MTFNDGENKEESREERKRKKGGENGRPLFLS